VVLGWLFVAVLTAAWLGAAASMARRREREARAHQYGESLEREWRAAVQSPPLPPEPAGPARRRRIRAQRADRC
jgi:hypothetical protein